MPKSEVVVGELYQLTFMDGKSYIGACTCGAENRYKDHRKSANGGSTSPVHKAWRKFGQPTLTVLKRNVPVEKLWFAEKNAIIKYNTKTPNGYNGRFGSAKPPGMFKKKIPDDVKNKIRTSLLNYFEKDPEAPEKNRQGQLKRFRDQPMSEETKDKNRQAQIKRFQDPKVREKNRLAQIKRFQLNPVSDKDKEIKRAAAQRYYQNPENKKKKSQTMLDWWKQRRRNIKTNSTV